MKINFTQIEKRLKSVRNALLSSGLEKTLTYKKLASESFNPSTGKNTVTYNEYAVDMIRSDTALEAQGASTVLSAIGFQSGKMFYFVKYEDMPRDPYDPQILKDYIVDGDKEYQIKKAVPIQSILVKIQV